jgi:hypothetical protein
MENDIIYLKDFGTHLFKIKEYFSVGNYELIKEYKNICIPLIVKYAKPYFYRNSDLILHVINNYDESNTTANNPVHCGFVWRLCQYSNVDMIVQLVNKGHDFIVTPSNISNLILCNKNKYLMNILKYLLCNHTHLKFDYSECLLSAIKLNTGIYIVNLDHCDEIINLLLDHITMNTVETKYHEMYKLAKNNKYIAYKTLQRMKELGFRHNQCIVL